MIDAHGGLKQRNRKLVVIANRIETLSLAGFEPLIFRNIGLAFPNNSDLSLWAEQIEKMASRKNMVQVEKMAR